jgi:hypothetical protein
MRVIRLSVGPFPSLVLGLVLLATLGLGLAACKQSEHERCQIDDDCEGNLICSTSQKICVQFGEMSPDAPTLTDAHPADAPIADAPLVDGPDALPVDAASD